jgi:hypothetical protein
LATHSDIAGIGSLVATRVIVATVGVQRRGKSGR